MPKSVRLSVLVAKYIQTEYEELSKRYKFETETGLSKWLLEEQNAPLHDAALLRNGSFQYFAEYLTSVHSDALKPVDPFDASHPISDYFIASSHNTFLTGNQLSSEASVDAYKNVRNSSALATGSTLLITTTLTSSRSYSEEAVALRSMSGMENPIRARTQKMGLFQHLQTRIKIKQLWASANVLRFVLERRERQLRKLR
jgi:hypothetical protein